MDYSWMVFFAALAVVVVVAGPALGRKALDWLAAFINDEY
jgi:hypothetical protein